MNGVGAVGRGCVDSGEPWPAAACHLTATIDVRHPLYLPVAGPRRTVCCDCAVTVCCDCAVTVCVAPALPTGCRPSPHCVL